MSVRRGLAWVGRQRRIFAAIVLVGTAGSMVELGWGRTTDWRSTSGLDRIAPHLRDAVQPSRAGSPVSGRSAGKDESGRGSGRPQGPEFEWLGHAGFWIRWGDLDLVMDPNLSDRCTVAPRRWSASALRAEVARRPAVDAVLISHGHFDHLDLPTLRSFPSVARLIVPTGARRYVDELDLPIQEVAPRLPLGTEPALRLGDLEVFVVPAAHHGNRLHPLQSDELAVGYVLRRGDTTVYFAGDTGDGPHIEQVADAFDIDWALLPIGAYLPRWPLGRVHLDPEGAVDVALRLGAETAVPMHFGTYRLSLDRTSWALPVFARAARRNGVRWQMPTPMGRSISFEQASS